MRLAILEHNRMARAVAAGVWYFGFPLLYSPFKLIHIHKERNFRMACIQKVIPNKYAHYELSPKNASERDDNYKVFLLLGIGGQRWKKCLQILYACMRCYLLYNLYIGRDTMRMSPNPLKNI